MRPCGRCGFALDNKATVCGRCGAAVESGPKATPGDPAPGPHPVPQLAEDLTQFDSPPVQAAGALVWMILSLPLILVLSIPLVVGGAVGYLVGDVVGATVGVITAMVIFLAVVAWREGRRRR